MNNTNQQAANKYAYRTPYELALSAFLRDLENYRRQIKRENQSE